MIPPKRFDMFSPLLGDPQRVHCVQIFLKKPENTVRLELDVQYVCMYVCMAITYGKVKDQPGKVANPARGQLNRENELFPVPVRA